MVRRRQKSPGINLTEKLFTTTLTCYMIFPAFLVSESLPKLVDAWSTLCSGTGGSREGNCPTVCWRTDHTGNIVPEQELLITAVLHQCSQKWGHNCKQYSDHLHSTTGSAKYSLSLPDLNGYVLVCIVGFPT